MIRRAGWIGALSAMALAVATTGWTSPARAGEGEAAKPAGSSVALPASEVDKKAKKKRAKWKKKDKGVVARDGRHGRIERLREVTRPGPAAAGKGSGMDAPRAVGEAARGAGAGASRTPEVPGQRRRAAKPWDAPSVADRLGEGGGGGRRAGAPWRAWTASGGSQSWIEHRREGSTWTRWQVTVTPTPSGNAWRRDEVNEHGQRVTIVTDDPEMAFRGRPSEEEVWNGPAPDWTTDRWIERGPDGEARLVEVTEVAPGRYERTETDPYGRRVVVVTDDPDVAYEGRPDGDSEGPWALADPKEGAGTTGDGEDPEWSSEDYDWDDEFADEGADPAGSERADDDSSDASSDSSSDDDSGTSSSNDGSSDSTDDASSDEEDDGTTDADDTETAAMPGPECGRWGTAVDIVPDVPRDRCGWKSPEQERREREEKKAKLERRDVSQPNPEDGGRDSCPSRDPWTGECRRMGGRGGTVDPGPDGIMEGRRLGPRRSLADVIEGATDPVTNPADR